MTEKIEEPTIEVGTVDIVNKIRDNDRASAIDDIHDLLFANSADAMAKYKEVVAKSMFDKPPETEPEKNETDNGTD